MDGFTPRERPRPGYAGFTRTPLDASPRDYDPRTRAGQREGLSLEQALALRGFAGKRTSAHAILDAKVRISKVPAELFLLFGSNETAAKRYLKVYDWASRATPGAGERAVIVVPVESGAPYSLSLPRGWREFTNGIWVGAFLTADPSANDIDNGATVLFHYEYEPLPAKKRR